MSKLMVIDRPAQCIYRSQFRGITSDCYCTKEECKKGNYVLFCGAYRFPEECPLTEVED